MDFREHKRVVCGLFTLVFYISSFKTIHIWHYYNFRAEESFATGIFEENFLLRGSEKPRLWLFEKHISLASVIFSISDTFYHLLLRFILLYIYSKR